LIDKAKHHIAIPQKSWQHR